MLERHVQEYLGREIGLGEDQFQLIPAAQLQVGSGLRAHADPIEPAGRQKRSVGFDCHLEVELVQNVYQGGIELEKRLTAGANDELVDVRWRCRGPLAINRMSQFLRRAVLRPAGSIGADEIRVTEITDRCGAIFLVPRP